MDAHIKELIILRYDLGETADKIGQSFGFTGETIRRVLRHIGKMRSRPEWTRRYSVNHNCFDSITIDSMYYAGLLMADGNITKDQTMVQIELDDKDIELLKGFKKFLNYSGTIGHRVRFTKKGKRQEMSSLRITSQQIVKSLVKFGVIFQKCRRSFIPEIVSNSSLAKFFFRGMFDGDGCFGIRHGTFSTGKRYAQLGANPKIAFVVKEWFTKTLGTTGGLCKRSDLFWAIHYGDTDATTLWKFLYSDQQGMRLIRKANKFNVPVA